MTATAAFVAQFEKEKGPRTRTRAKALAPIEVAMDDAKRRAASGDWSAAKGSSFVGLYAICHHMIYGVVPDELFQAGVYKVAAKIAANALHDLFADDPDAMAAFVRWCWVREKRKHNWALGNGFDRNRLGWKWQFSRALLTDYRVSTSQKRR
jgi:hypothetical protein